MLQPSARDLFQSHKPQLKRKITHKKFPIGTEVYSDVATGSGVIRDFYNGVYIVDINGKTYTLRDYQIESTLKK